MKNTQFHTPASMKIGIAQMPTKSPWVMLRLITNIASAVNKSRLQCHNWKIFVGIL